MTGIKDGKRRQDVRLRDLGVPILLPLWLALAALDARAAQYFASHSEIGHDAHAYWVAARHAHPYHAGPTMRDAYLYSPAFKQLVWPLAHLPWPVFCAVWMVAESAAFVWLLRPLGWAWGVPAFLLCGFEIIGGNVMGFLAVALVIGFRRPGAWAVALLTKVVVCLGPVWFAVRREWMALFRFAAVTGVIVLVSVAVDPASWGDWLRFLADHRGTDPTLVPRVLAALVVVGYAARCTIPWLLAPALVLASPVLHGIGQYLTVLAAVPLLLREVPGVDPSSHPAGVGRR